MSEILLPQSASRYRSTLLLSIDRFNYLDGTVCLVEKDLLESVSVNVFRNRVGLHTNGPINPDDMILELPPVKGDEEHDHNLAIASAIELEYSSGFPLEETMRRLGLNNN